MYSPIYIYAARIAARFEVYQSHRPRYRVTDASGFEKTITPWEIGLLHVGCIARLPGMVVERRIGRGAWEELHLDV